ncbi:copper amine oxidase N-terminal domain-containing protein [Paenibacillus pabuli]|uniref:copper amine oxidase N-terminal domain-containing protein n=1 Tax=Paenibacillus pabuli TaxID=1472 RepID=UPI0032427191
MKKKVLIPLITAFGLTCMTAGVMAAPSIEKITAYLNKEININIDGRIYVPKDQNNEIIDPIIYNNSTYLPLRSVAEALNIQVDWDGATQTVDLWTEAGSASRPTEDTTSSGGSNTTTPAVTLNDDSNAVIKDGMSSYTFDKAFATVHALALKNNELNDTTKLKRFVFQASKEYWNQSPTKFGLAHKTLYNTDALDQVMLHHALYEKESFNGLLSLDVELKDDFSNFGYNVYTVTGTAVKSIDGGQNFYKVRVKGELELGIAKNGDVRVNKIDIIEDKSEVVGDVY